MKEATLLREKMLLFLSLLAPRCAKVLSITSRKSKNGAKLFSLEPSRRRGAAFRSLSSGSAPIQLQPSLQLLLQRQNALRGLQVLLSQIDGASQGRGLGSSAAPRTLCSPREPRCSACFTALRLRDDCQQTAAQSPET